VSLAQFPSEFVWVLLAVFGGVAKYLDLYVRNTGPLVWAKFISSVIVSSFAGFISAQVMILIYPTWVFIAAAIGGYASTKILDVIVELLQYKLGVPDKNVKKNKNEY